MADRNDIVTFLNDVSKQFESFCSSSNPSGKVDKQSWDTPLGRLDVVISAGEVFEKAGSIYCDLEIETPPVLAEEIGQKGSKAEAFVYEINLFPLNPLIPKGYMELRVNITDKIVLAGGTDIFPYFPGAEEDVTFFADGMKELCARHGQDYQKLQKIRADFFMSKYRKEKVGSHAGIYSFHLEEKDFDFFKEMAETFFKIYGTIVARGKDKSFTEEDKALSLKIHGLWTQWILLEDEGTKFGMEKGIPPDALLGAILPPKATF
jgi:coproporphyrinogen III oxidase